MKPEELSPYEIPTNQEMQKDPGLEDIGEIQDRKLESDPNQETQAEREAINQSEGIPQGGSQAQQIQEQNIPKSETLIEIEKYMSENIEDAFAQMTPAEQQRFREEGEKTAMKIQEMIQKAKVKAKKIVKLLKNWLRLIPGVNKVFLEQEAKIKTDRIIEYAERQEKEKIYQ